MATKSLTVFDIYPNAALAEHAVDDLVTSGFSSDGISVLLTNPHAPIDSYGTGDTKVVPKTNALVGTLGFLSGVGPIVIPNAGSFIAAGPLMAVLTEKADSDNSFGLSGILMASGVAEYEAVQYEGRIKNGEVLLSISCATPKEALLARDLLRQARKRAIASTDDAKSGPATRGTP